MQEFDQFEKKLSGAMRRSLERLGDQIVDDIKDNLSDSLPSPPPAPHSYAGQAPYQRSGDLKASITRSVDANGNGVNLVIYSDGNAFSGGYNYSADVEYGNGTTDPHPFMRPVIQKHKSGLMQALAESIVSQLG